MVEDYSVPNGARMPNGVRSSAVVEHITGRASYERFRRFDVTSTDVIHVDDVR